MGSAARDDRGQVLPLIAVVASVLIIGIFWLAQLGVAGWLRASGQSAADAAALAAAAAYRHQAERVLRQGHPGGVDLARPDTGPARVAAQDHATRNGARLRRYDAALREVRVEVETRQAMQSRAAARIGVNGTRGEAAARVRFQARWRAATPTLRSRGAPLSEAEIQAIFARNGLTYDPADPPRTALRYPGSCSPGPDVKNLQPRMHDAIARLEHHDSYGIGPLSLVSGYRRPGCGAAWGHSEGLELYAPENYGDAVRVGASQRGAVAARQTLVGLCRPYPGTDPGLFAHRLSLICAGRTGDLDERTVYGGDLRSIVDLEVELIRDEGALGNSGA